MEAEKESLIKAALRSVAASVPVAASLAQAWNEYETVRQNKRIEEFFAVLREELASNSESVSQLQHLSVKKAEFPELLEHAIAATKRTYSAGKRAAFARALAGFVIAAPESLTGSDCQTLIDTIDQLTEYDIAVLNRFRDGKITKYEELLSDTSGPLTGAEYERLPVAVSKLESRGLVTDATPPAEPYELAAIYAGGSSSRWVRARFVLTSFGKTLLKLLNETQQT